MMVRRISKFFRYIVQSVGIEGMAPSHCRRRNCVALKKEQAEMSVPVGSISTAIGCRSAVKTTTNERIIRRLALSTAMSIGVLGGSQHAAFAQAVPTNYQVFFDFDHADLTPKAVQIVDEAAANAAAGKVSNIDVTGYTDTVGSEEYNLRLSRRRALTVQAELTKQGIPASEIAIFAKGKHDLLVPTADGVKEPQNRRVQIVYAGTTGMGPAPVATPAPAATGCTGEVDPYKNYACLDTYLGEGFFERFLNYYKLEWGQAGPPTDPNAPPSSRDGWPKTPETTPPMPFTEWPYGGTTTIGVNRTGSADSPFMAAIANTSLGEWMSDNGIQTYGWIDPGFNVSSNTVRPGGNAPINYAYTPNTVQLDQAVLYAERTPDTVQTDHIDWGFRFSAIYGENYRYTQSYSPFTAYQFNKNNQVNGYDFPMVYAELYVPYIAEGLMLRLGRYISLPDIEAQLAPNNYMYTHSFTYGYDNYTNEGLQASLFVAKDLMLQLGVSAGTEAWIGHAGQEIRNLDPNPLYPGKTYLKDPGDTPSLTACVRYTWNDGNDNIYPCADAINGGQWGYNNVQWYGTTYYHKFNDQWHFSFEAYDIFEHGVPNENNRIAEAAFQNGGTPFSPQNVPFNGPNLASCHSVQAIRCTVHAVGTVAYLNYQVSPLDNISFRPEYYYDPEGWRTGVRTEYVNISLGWQHWLSPQIEFRPEVGYYRSLSALAFNGNSAAGIAPDKNYTVLGAMDMIIHF
jgi:outer membrane protein OmpA-like peptidoglycan-associated protein